MGRLVRYPLEKGYRLTDAVLYSARGPDWLYGDGSEIRQGAVGSLPRMPRSLFVYAPSDADLLEWLGAAALMLRPLRVAVHSLTAAPSGRPFTFPLPTDAEVLANPEVIVGGDVFVAVITNYRVRLNPKHDLANTEADYAMSLVGLGNGGDEYINDEGDPGDGDEIGWTVYQDRATEDRVTRSILTPRFRSFHTAFYQVNAEQDPGGNPSDIIPDDAIEALFGDDPTMSRRVVSGVAAALTAILSDAEGFFS